MHTTASRLSLLYPPGHSREHEESIVTDASIASLLQLDSLFQYMKQTLRFKPNQQLNPLVYLSSDAQVISHRLDVIEDLLENESLYLLLKDLVPDLEDMKELMTADMHQPEDTAAMMSAVSQLELYTNLVDKLDRYFQSGSANTIRSVGIRLLRDQIRDIAASANYMQLKTEYEKLTTSIVNIKSVTIGVNLDAQFNPIEAGIVSLNVARYQSGSIIDKLLRADLSENPFHCLAPLEATTKGMSPQQASAFRASVNQTLTKVLKSSLKNWRPAVRLYTREQTLFLTRLAEELRFLIGSVALLRKLRELGMPVCKPTVIESTASKPIDIQGLYNPVLALQHTEGEHGTPMNRVVRNDLQFDENGMIYLITGPNQGGKSVYLRAVGIAQLLFQLGLFIPAETAEMSPIDHLFIHFPDETDGSSKGRFAEECQRLSNLFTRLTPNSLVLMDETFSSTSASEASYIAEEVLKGMREYRCRVLFATHLHDLVRRIDELNGDADGKMSRIDSLTAVLDASQAADGVRSYKIMRTRPDGDSYARHIAQKYGLTLEHLLSSLNNRNFSSSI